jgi:hypothetical protein
MDKGVKGPAQIGFGLVEFAADNWVSLSFGEPLFAHLGHGLGGTLGCGLGCGVPEVD